MTAERALTDDGRAKDAGFSVTCKAFRRSRADLDHYIYVLEESGAA